MKLKNVPEKTLLYVTLTGLLMIGLSPITYGITNEMLFGKKQKENPGMEVKNLHSAHATAANAAAIQIAVGAAIAILAFENCIKSKERE